MWAATFIGIKVKYHEDLRGEASTHKAPHDEIADEMGCFAPDLRERLRSMPLQQIWRDHLLAGALRHVDGFDDGFFVLLSPKGNGHCADAVSDYRTCLTNEDSFGKLALEDVVAALRRHTDAEWVELFFDRYLAFDKVDAELAAASRHD